MKDKFKQVDELFRPWDSTKTPGCAIAIVQKGEVIYKNGYGMATMEHDVTIKSSTAFYIASTSKQFAAFCMALLEEEGKLSVDDDIRKYIPEIPQYESSIQIKHLIHHTSGLRDFLELNALSGRHYDELITPEDALRMISNQKELNFKPGERYLYSNSGYFLLSVLVERISGKTMRQFAQEKIFNPLDMINTHFHDDRRQPVKNRAIGYSFDRDGTARISVPGLETVGSGGIYSTVEDLARWDRNFYDNCLGKGNQQLINRIQIPGIFNDGTAQDYAFGLSVQNYHGLKKVSHSGGYGGYSAEFTRFPEHKLTVICLSNNSSLPAPSMALKIADIFLSEFFADEEEQEMPVEPIEVSSELINQLAGYYYHPSGEMVVHLTADENQLVLNIRDMLIPLTASSTSNFYILNGPIRASIEFSTRDGEKQADIKLGNQKDHVQLQKMNTVSLPAAEIELLCGHYYSDELDNTATLYFENDELHMKCGRHRAKLVPGENNIFIPVGDVLSNSLLILDRNGSDIRKLVFNGGRVRNIAFIKV